MSQLRTSIGRGGVCRHWFLWARVLRPTPPAIASIALALLAVLVWTYRADAHTQLERASPPPDGLLAAPPHQIDLWMTEAVAQGAGSPGLRVLDEAGTEQKVRDLHVDPDDRRHVLAGVAGLGTGTFTVSWTTRSDQDGHTETGSYAFRVGTARAPGAATVQGESPRVWAVATRWLTFLGASLAGAGFLYRPVILAGAIVAPAAARRRAIATVAGAAVGLAATVAEPFLTTWQPPSGAIAPSLGDAVRGLPRAWWLRPAGLVIALGLGIVLLALASRGRNYPASEWGGGAICLIALLGLTFTSHASARESWRALALVSDVFHQWSVGLWVGGLAHLALSWPPGRSPSEAGAAAVAPDPVRRFSRYALGLVVVGVGTGVLNAGLALPTVRSLWNSDYGHFIIAKAVVLVPVLALATFHRASLRRAAVRAGAALRTTVRLEAALVLLIVLGGSILALLAPPLKVTGTARLLDLAAPADDAAPAGKIVVRLQVAPAKPGNNQMTVVVEGPKGVPLPADQIALVRLDFASLDHDAQQRDIETRLNGRGGFASQGVQLSLDGWWRVDVLVRQLGAPDTTVSFFLMLPDPNVNGFDSVPAPKSSDEATAMFERGLHGMTSMHSVRFTQRLSGGTGTVVLASNQVKDGSDGQPPASSLASNEIDIITIGVRRWLRQSGGDWNEGDAPPVYTPDQWGGDYKGATGFQLGRVEDVGGEPTRVVSFFVPGTPRLAAAYYSWWVSKQSGRVLRETMVSRSHYMVYTFTDINQPMVIDPPSLGVHVGTPVAANANGS